MRAIFIYDNTGKIYHWAQGDFIAPVGLPYLIIEDYDFEEKRVEKIDTSVNPPVPIYGMTKEELIREGMTLEEYKECRQIENKELLAVFLKENPLLWTDGLYYGVTQEDQSEMLADKTAYEFKKSIGKDDWKLQWHGIKSDCRDFTEEEFAGLLNAIVNFVYPYRQLEMQYKKLIYSATTKKEVENIKIVYQIQDGENRCVQ